MSLIRQYRDPYNRLQIFGCSHVARRGDCLHPSGETHFDYQFIVYRYFDVHMLLVSVTVHTRSVEANF